MTPRFNGFTFMAGFWIMILLLFGMASYGWPQQPLTGYAPVPESVLLFEKLKPLMPRLTDSSTPAPYGGLSLCKLWAKRDQPQPFFALPSDRGDDSDCVVPPLIVAYGGFCTAGVEDAVTGVHFSQPLLPSVEIVRYDGTWVIYLNHYLKSHVKRTSEGQQAALAYLRGIQALDDPWLAPHDVRCASVPLFSAPHECLPPKKGQP